MSISRLPSGRWRAQVYDPRVGRNVSVSRILGGEGTFRTKGEARTAREDARKLVGGERTGTSVTVWEFRERWISDPLHARPKRSTDIHNAERTLKFAERYQNVTLLEMGGERGDAIVADWLAGGKHLSSVPALRAMFNDAMSAKAGRLLRRNPFAGLGLKKTSGNAKKDPPAEEKIESMIRLARDLTPPSFAAWLETACKTAARPGELDGLRWEWVDFTEGEIHLKEQWNVKVRDFTEPKYGPYTVAMVGDVRQLLLTMKRDRSALDGSLVFTTVLGSHYTPSSRTHHWNRVRAAAGLGNVTLYLATRHYFGWYLTNVLELPQEIVAHQLGHKDGGRLVATLYGHLEGKNARRRIREAYDRTANVTPLRVVRDDAS